jgi:hypothetical protein
VIVEIGSALPYGYQTLHFRNAHAHRDWQVHVRRH